MQLTITKAEAIPIIKAAYDAKTLPAQNGMGGTYYAEAHGKVIRCAIGALFSPEDAKALEGGGPSASYQMVSDLMKTETLVVDDTDWFVSVQKTHDNWADNADDPRDYATEEKRFLELLQ